MDARELRGMQIAATATLRHTAEGWLVPSQSGPAKYSVREIRHTFCGVEAPSEMVCSCPDFEERAKPCKHIFAVEFVMKREVVTPDGEILEQEFKFSYSQNWTAYNRAQCEEKDRFMPMLAELCNTIVQPKQGNGRPRLPMSDMAFTAISKVYSGLSARRFDSDVREAAAKGLTAQDPHFNSVLRYLRSPEMTPVLKGLVEISALPLKAVEQDFAVDSTGFTTSRFVRWYDHKWGKEMTKREWVKLHAMTGVRTNVVTSVELSDWRGNDSPYFAPLLAATAENFDIRDVSADKAYSSKANLQAVADIGGTPFVPFKQRHHDPQTEIYLQPPIVPPLPTATAWARMYHMFAFQRDTFLARYHQRSNVETTFSMIKAKFGDSLRSKSDVGQMNEVLCKVIAHNLCVLIACIHELGLEVPSFTNSLAS